MGLAVGDALGAPYEGLPGAMVYDLGPAAAIVEHASGKPLVYTDDTQMMIGVAETLVRCGRIDQDALAAAFARNYDPNRGYGPGAVLLLEAVVEGGDWRDLSTRFLPGGSYGNGAAMRVAPVGLVFCHDLDEVEAQAELSAVITHAHPLGVEGARLLAVAVALAARMRPLDHEAFYAELSGRARTEEFQWALSVAAELKPDDSVAALGNSLEAHRSVVTAIACFSASPESYSDGVSRAIGLGNDTDTLAAMAGAVSGAHLGAEAIPRRALDALEVGRKGRAYIEELARQLYDVHARL